MATALLFDRDTVGEIDWNGHGLPRLGRSSILWIDLDDPDGGELRHLVDQLGLAEASVQRLTEKTEPQLLDHGEYLHVTAFAPSDPTERRLERVDCFVSQRWVVTVHSAPIAVLDTFRDRTTGSGSTGNLDGPHFLAALLEWVLTSYLDAFEELERVLEDIDTDAMRGDFGSKEDVLERLVALRREIGHLRRALVSHREVVLALTRPELDAISSSRSADRFCTLRDRLEEVVHAARDSREAVVGSFDVLTASTGQRTNEIMKVLTLASVLFLPGALLAGIMGMNFKAGLFEHVALFWVTVAVIVGVAVSTIVAARMRDWI